MSVKPVVPLIAFAIFILCHSAQTVAAPPTHTISGVVATAEGIGVEGVDVVPNGGIAAIVTATDGSYSITVPKRWTGTVTASKTGWLITPPSTSYPSVSDNITEQNYLAYQPKISGFVTKADGTPLSGVTVTADNGGGIYTTYANGYYEFNIPYDWSGTVSASLTRYHFAEKSCTNVIIDQSNQNFTATYVGLIVKADGTGNYPTIQSAIDAAVNREIIYVKDGIYTGDGNRDIDFKGKPISVRGNVTDPNLVVIDCQGTEAEPHRGFFFNSGEDSQSILEGFTITNGYGPHFPGSSFSAGGAVLCDHSSPVIRDCIISDNTAYLGGGIYIDYISSSPTIQNCIIRSNHASSSGGGVRSGDGIIENCKIIGNTARIASGIDAFRGVISNCIIAGNSAEFNGGGLQDCSGTIENCIIKNNTALTYGGGGLASCDGTIRNCIISNNSTGGDEGNGAGLSFCDATIENCVIKENSSASEGGGFYRCDGIIRNCIISNNSAIIGGGISYCNSTISGCTIVSNSAQTLCGGIGEHPNETIENCIIWGNTAEYYPQVGWSTPKYCCIQDWTKGGEGNISSDPLFIDAENGDYHLSLDSPCLNTGDLNFVPAQDETDIDTNQRILGGRVDMGADEVGFDGPYIYVDHERLNFVVYENREDTQSQELTIANLGTEELNWSIGCDCPCLYFDKTTGHSDHTTQDIVTISVDTTQLSHGNYSYELIIFDSNAINNPKTVLVEFKLTGFTVNSYGTGDYPTIQAAINAAVNEDVVQIEDGVYTGDGNRDISFLGKAITVCGNSLNPNMVVIDCQGTEADPHRGFIFTGGENAYSVLEGVTIKNGYGLDEDFGGYGTVSSGGAIYCKSSSPTFKSCTFDNNRAIYGGGFFLLVSHPTISKSIFINNQAAGGNGINNGGGIYCRSSNPKINNCLFTNNSADTKTAFSDGGGFFNYQSNPEITSCIFTSNSAKHGGGIYNHFYSYPLIKNSVFNGNSAMYGAAIYNYSFTFPKIVNATLINNTAYSGGAISTTTAENSYQSAAELNGCIIWNNSQPQITESGGASPTNINYSNVQGGWPGEGNIDSDPLFKPDGCHLNAWSPCIDTGNNIKVTEPNDLEGLSRIIDGNCDGTATVDIGAYEFDFLFLGDFEGDDCDVDLEDLAVMAQSWQRNNPVVDIAPHLAPDGIINLEEFLVIVENWLVGVE